MPPRDPNIVPSEPEPEGIDAVMPSSIVDALRETMTSSEEATPPILTREMLQRAAQMVDRPPRRSTRTNSSDFVWRSFEEGMRPITVLPNGRVIEEMDAPQDFSDRIDEPPRPLSPPLTKEEEQRLSQATERLMKESEERIRGNVRQAEEREAEYVNLIRNQKAGNMTGREIMHSDIPIYIGQLHHRKMKEIAMLGNRGIRFSPDGQLELQCNACGRSVPGHFAFFCGGHIFCAEHVPNYELCGVCEYLQADCRAIHTYDDRDIHVCARCVDRYRECGCGNQIHVSYIEARRCQRCIENEGSTSARRSFTRSLKWCSPDEPGSILKSKRMVSAEVEALTPDQNFLVTFAAKYPKEGGIGSDRSVQGAGHGFEIQTPRLAGKRGEEFIQRACSALKSIKSSINQTCGMHIHLDGKGIVVPSRKVFPTSLIQLWKTHVVFEDVVMSFLPFDRRNNRYCRPMAQTFSLTEIDTIESLLDAEKLWYKNRTYEELREAKRAHYHASRYFGVNFHSLLGHGHLEIRHHSGTLNPKKILEWANLHALIMDAAQKKLLTHEFLQEALQTSVIKEKTKMLFDTIGLSESSRAYFYHRQKKFSKRTAKEGEVEDEPVAAVANGVRPDTARTGRLTATQVARIIGSSNGI